MKGGIPGIVLIVLLIGACWGDTDTEGEFFCSPHGIYCESAGGCVDHRSDNLNCGACNNACDVKNGYACREGACACAGGLSECDGKCADFQSDNNNCSSCGMACASGWWACGRFYSNCCIGGNCGSSIGGLCHCGETWIDVASSDEHCGSCDNPCDFENGFTCLNGTCSCASGLTACGGKCVNTSTDPDNCGGCGNSCDVSDCNNGFCDGQSCPGTVCDEVCVDTSSNPSNCGGCAVDCIVSSGAKCLGGTCICQGNLTDCDGNCVDLQTDPHNCGACGIKCCSAAGCSNGTCKIGCVCDFPTCGDGDCIEPVCDCPLCCAPGQTCQAGQCV